MSNELPNFLLSSYYIYIIESDKFKPMLPRILKPKSP